MHRHKWIELEKVWDTKYSFLKIYSHMRYCSKCGEIQKYRWSPSLEFDPSLSDNQFLALFDVNQQLSPSVNFETSRNI